MQMLRLVSFSIVSALTNLFALARVKLSTSTGTASKTSCCR